MKTYLIILFTISFLILGAQVNCVAKIKIKFAFGDKSAINDCAGRGICAYIIFKVVDDNFNEKDLPDNMGLAIIDIIDGKMKMDIIYDNSEDRFKSEFEVAHDISLSEEICEKLGYQSILIHTGQYNLDFSKFQYGSVKLNVETR